MEGGELPVRHRVRRKRREYREPEELEESVQELPDLTQLPPEDWVDSFRSMIHETRISAAATLQPILTGQRVPRAGDVSLVSQCLASVLDAAVIALTAAQSTAITLREERDIARAADD